MKISGSQRKLYVLSAALLLATVVICTAFGLWGAPSGSDTTALPSATPGVLETPTPSPQALAPETTAAPESGSMRTVVYYQDNYGYLVPVTRTIPAAEGVAKATLAMMVSSAYNDMEAARLGLRTVLPEGTTMDLDVTKDGVARIDLSDNVLKVADAEAEANLVAAVVQTLTEFPTVQKVKFLIDGQTRDRLSFGTDVSGEFERGTLNLETSDASLSPAVAQMVQLYFPGESSSLIVPVTRMVYGKNDLDTAVLELTKGPGGQCPLEPALPSGCGLIGVTLKDGVATVNFTKEFMNIAQESDGGRIALRALLLTCTRFEGVQSVKIQVEGQPYDPGLSAMATPTFVNDAAAINQESLRTQTAALLDFE